MKSKLVFNEDRHEYMVDGVVVPSVTQIIRFLSFDTAATASPAMRDAAAERGSRVHAACTAFDFDGENAEIDGDIAGYIRAYASFLRDYSVKHWLLFETPMSAVIGEMAFAGTIDRLGSIDNTPTLVDIKTGARMHMPRHRAQLAGYRYLMRENGYVVESSAVLHLRRDGTYGYHAAPPDDPEAMSAFIACWKIHKYLEGKTK